MIRECLINTPLVIDADARKEIFCHHKGYKVVYKNLMTGNPSGQLITQISVEELAQRLATGDPTIQLIDVREPQELAAAKIEGFVNLPLSEFVEWGDQVSTMFNPHAETLVLCHHGIRSAQMCQWLLAQGFTNVQNITGGIDAYSLLVDSSIPQY
jgi:rhodanese-related sulfurtransferase